MREIDLYLGLEFNVHGKDEPEPFHAQIGSDVSDLPASRKTSGLVSFTSKHFMCDRCDTPFYGLVDPESFKSTSTPSIDALKRTHNSSALNPREPSRYLKYAFRARDASAEVAEEITRRRGVRWSAMDGLVNWLPGDTGLFDMMHCIFGCKSAFGRFPILAQLFFSIDQTSMQKHPVQNRDD